MAEEKINLIELIDDWIHGWWFWNVKHQAEAYNLVKEPAGKIKDIGVENLNLMLMFFILGFGSTILAIFYAIMHAFATLVLLFTAIVVISGFIIASFWRWFEVKFDAKIDKKFNSGLLWRAIFIIGPPLLLLLIIFLLASTTNKTTAITILLLVGFSALGASYLLLGVIKEGIIVAYLITLLYKNITIDAQLEVINFLWDELSAIVKWFGHTLQTAARLGMSLIPGATLEEVNKALESYPKFPELKMNKVFAKTISTLGEMMLKVRSYGKAIDNFFQATLFFQFIFLVVNYLLKFGNHQSPHHLFNNPFWCGGVILVLLSFSIFCMVRKEA